MTTHPRFTDFEHRATLVTKTGSLWIGDPCYVIKDNDEKRPKDLGKAWVDIADRFLTRSGDKQAAEFKHDMGHTGMGVMVSTYDGRVEVPLYVQYGGDGGAFGGSKRPRRVLVDFAPDLADALPAAKGDHRDFAGFVEVGSVDVDAGCVFFADPAGVLTDPGARRPEDFGADWGEFCNRMFERSGYDAEQEAYSKHRYKRDGAWSTYFAKNVDWTKYKEMSEEDREALRKTTYEAFDAQYVEEPYVSQGLDTGVSNFKRDDGRDGLCSVISTYYGDGGYPVYVLYGQTGRPRMVLVDFDPSGDEDDEE
uniref:DUF4241 domain-containing protein n=1 Tax=Caulobacter phage BL57 TaxID=3348355 RepID=A0AB74UJ33_9VIRU